MASGSKSLRRVELALWVLGIVLLGVAARSTLARWLYQEQQERALFERGPAVAPVRVTPVSRAADPPVIEVADRLSPPDHLPPAESDAAIRPLPPVEPASRPPAADPAAVGRIEIPRLGLRAIVARGDDEKTLTRAVGLVPGTALPGELGNMVLAGHRDTFFWPLQDVEVGDQIRMVIPGRMLRYRVDSVRIVEPDETSVLGSRGTEELTLVTCYPFRYVGPAPQRFIVSATRMN